MHKSIVISCDTYYYGLANELGIDLIHRFLSGFGFGSRTGIDIEGELSGLAPRRMEDAALQAEMVRGRHRERGHRAGLLAHHAAAARRGHRTLANNGVPVHPRLLKAVQDSKTQRRARSGWRQRARRSR